MGNMLGNIIMRLMGTNQKKAYQKGEYVVFKLNNYCKFFSFLFIFISAALVILIINFYDNSIDAILMLIFSSISFFLFCFFFLASMNLKIIYKNGIIVRFSIFGRLKYKFAMEDVISAKEIPKNNIKLTFKNGKNIKIYYQMENYETIKIILHENNIKLNVKKSLFDFE